MAAYKMNLFPSFTALGKEECMQENIVIGHVQLFARIEGSTSRVAPAYY